MSMAKKGSRKITVEGVDYRWGVSRYRLVSDWRIDTDFVGEKYVEIARRFGLGEVADVVFNIVIELYQDPKSRIRVKYFGLIIDGFLGPEQYTQIKPRLIAEIVEQSITNGWDPGSRGDYNLEIIENTGEKSRPAVLVLPGFNDDVVDYDNIVKPIRIA